VNRSRKRGLRGLAGLTLVALTAGLGATTAQANDNGGVPIPPLDSPQQGSDGNDGGTSVDPSIGDVQIGPVAVDPSSTVGSVADATATVGSTTTATGTQPGGLIQVGGADAAVGSTAGVRLSSWQARTVGHVRPVARAASRASAPVRVAGIRASNGSDSAVVAQVGSRHSGAGSSGAVRANPATAGVSTPTRHSAHGSRAAAVRSASGGEIGAVLDVDRTGSRKAGSSAITAGFAPGVSETSLAVQSSRSGSGTHAVAAAGGAVNGFLDGRLPYTGLALWFLLVAALLVLVCGRVLR
jgi:hypothetical protein